MKNPFKFGTVVEGRYFTNRKSEIAEIKSILESDNHIAIISPRRFGKTSLINRIIKENSRPFIFLDLQLVTNIEDFASQILKRLYRVYPFERIKQFIKNFRIIPVVSLNPVSGEVDISFQSSSNSSLVIEDVLNLINRLSKPSDKIIVVFDEFQDVKNIDKNLIKTLRSIMQHHPNVNYIFMGSQESLMRDVFEKKKSPFYHFAYLFPLGKIPQNEFKRYLSGGLKQVTGNHITISEEIINFTRLHPYYTQQLAFSVWENLKNGGSDKNSVNLAVNTIVQNHDIDYERLWNTFNRTDMKVLIGMSLSHDLPLSQKFLNDYGIGATSTAFSSMKRLMVSGIVIKTGNEYMIDDPFFVEWIKKRRQA